jgi:hypothetical protein
VPIKSQSVKSLTKSKYETNEKNIPFSTAVKNSLAQTDRKSIHQTPKYSPYASIVPKNEKAINKS